jgi:hypothetical protein
MKGEMDGKWDLSEITDGQRIGLRSHVELAGEALSFVYRMTHFIHHNPLHEFESRPFFEAARKARPLFGNRTTFSQGDWLDLLGRGRVTRPDLETILLRENPAHSEKIDFLPGEERYRMVDLLILHMIHEWDLPGETDPMVTEGRPAFLRLRRDLDPVIHDRHATRMAGSGPDSSDPEAAYVGKLWEESLRRLRERAARPLEEGEPSRDPLRPGRFLTLLEWVDAMDEEGWSEKVDHYLVKWLSAFLDEGVSAWNMPHRDRGFYRSWRSMAVHDREIFFWGLVEAFGEIPRLPDNPEDTLIGSLMALDLPKDFLTDYFERHAVSLPGWFGYIKWRSSRTDDPWQQAHPIDIVMVLSIRLFLEQAIVGDFCRRKLGVPGTLPAVLEWIDAHPEEMQTRGFVAQHGIPSGWIPDLVRFGGRLPPPGDPAWAVLSVKIREEIRSRSPEEWVRRRAGRIFHVAQSLGLSPEALEKTTIAGWTALERWLDLFDRGRREEIWQRALELRLESELLEKVSLWTEKESDLARGSEAVRPLAQVLFCIDIRSERLRRHIESLGGYATYGLGGFFGIPFRFQPYQKPPGQLQSPVLLTPRHRVQEIPRAYEIERADLHFRRHQKTRSLIHLFHELKDHVITPYVLVEALGWFYLFPFFGKTFFPRGIDRLTRFIRRLFLPEIATALTVAKTAETEALAMVEAEQHARIRKACLTLLGPHTRAVSSETVEELRQKALEEKRSLGRLSSRAREELSVNLSQEADLVRKLRTLYLINTRRTRVLMETIMTTGFTLEEQAFYIETSLRMTGLVRNFSRLVLVCGHGSESQNNPFESALDCGACGGNRGIPNARVYVEMANNPAVRDILRKRDIPIPYDTHFLAGEHNTTTDQIEFFDLEAVPLTHRRDLKRLWRDLEEAGQRTAAERDRTLPRVFDSPRPFSLPGLLRRSCDYSEVRPEWGLSGNAWFVVGSRELTGSPANFGGRAFLHSYDYSIDTTGRDLESILTGPLIVGEWINAEHYFSTLDPVVFGGGNKVYHNVVGQIGVMWGNESDLLAGLPVQALRDGPRLAHEPVRLTVMVEAPRSRIGSIIEKNPVLKDLFRNEWMLLIGADPGDRSFYRFHFPDFWSPIRPR